MEKYIKDISELNLGKMIASGSCSSIYQFGNEMYFKRFNDDYSDLNDSINVEFLEVVRYLSEIPGMPFIIRGKDIYRSVDELFGYSMPIIDGVALHSIGDDVLVSCLFDSIDALNKNIRVLANYHVKTEDVGGDNIFYNGNMYLLDLDLSLVDYCYVPDELYERCLHSVLCAVRSRVFGDARYDDKVKDGDYLSYFNYFKDICSESVGDEIQTIGEFRGAYQKVKNKYFN